MEQFVEYCKLYKSCFDDSFLSDDELKNYDLDDNLTLLLHKNNEILGVCSIMLNRNNRVRLFHTVDGRFESYEMLHHHITEILKAEYKSDQYGLFLPLENTEVIHTMSRLGFETERNIYVLERTSKYAEMPSLPTSFSMSKMTFPDDVKHWTNIRNTAFKSLKGYVEYPESYFEDMSLSSEYIESGTLIISKDTTPIGIAKLSKEIEENIEIGFIGPIAVLPEYQGRGLGRKLLQALIYVSEQNRFSKSYLCVNADNEDALKLYLSEGFIKQESVTAMKFNL